jgi:hypothetical protein
MMLMMLPRMMAQRSAPESQANPMMNMMLMKKIMGSQDDFSYDYDAYDYGDYGYDYGYDYDYDSTGNAQPQPSMISTLIQRMMQARAQAGQRPNVEIFPKAPQELATPDVFVESPAEPNVELAQLPTEVEMTRRQSDKAQPSEQVSYRNAP